jgi:hypothetical protein
MLFVIYRGQYGAVTSTDVTSEILSRFMGKLHTHKIVVTWLVLELYVAWERILFFTTKICCC